MATIPDFRALVRWTGFHIDIWILLTSYWSSWVISHIKLRLKTNTWNQSSLQEAGFQPNTDKPNCLGRFQKFYLPYLKILCNGQPFQPNAMCLCHSVTKYFWGNYKRMLHSVLFIVYYLVIKWRRMRFTKHAACIGEIRNTKYLGQRIGMEEVTWETKA